MGDEVKDRSIEIMKTPKLALKKKSKQDIFDIYCDNEVNDEDNNIIKYPRSALRNISKQEKFSIYCDDKMTDENNVAILSFNMALRSKSQGTTKQKKSHVTFQTNDKNSIRSIQTPS